MSDPAGTQDKNWSKRRTTAGTGNTTSELQAYNYDHIIYSCYDIVSFHMNWSEVQVQAFFDMNYILLLPLRLVFSVCKRGTIAFLV